MKKIIAALALFCMITQITPSAEARLHLRHKIGDLVKGRKNNDDTKSLEKIAYALKGLGTSFASSGSAQFRYVNSKFLSSEDDMSFLIAYSSFAKNSEMFFSLLENLLMKMRTEYAALLGAQNRLDKTKREKTQEKMEERSEESKSNMQKSLDILMGNGFKALRANLQCSAIILLKIVQEEETVSEANLTTIKKQMAAFSKKYSSAFELIGNNLGDILASAQSESGYDGDISSKTESLLNDIDLVHDVLVTLGKYTNRRSVEAEGIERILQKTSYAGTASSEDDEADESADDEADESADEEESEEQDDQDEEEAPRKSKKKSIDDDEEDSDEDEDELGEDDDTDDTEEDSDDENYKGADDKDVDKDRDIDDKEKEEI